MLNWAVPELRHLILDALQDDVEQVYNVMQMLGEWRSQSETELTRLDVVVELKALLADGLVIALEESNDRPELVPVSRPETTDEAIENYWFEPTAQGSAVWKEWSDSAD